MASLSSILRAAIVDKVRGYVEANAGTLAEEVVDKEFDDEVEEIDEAIREKLDEMMSSEMQSTDVREEIDRVLEDMK